MTAPYSGALLPSPHTVLGGAVAHLLAARHLVALHRRLRQVGATSDPGVLEYLDALHYATRSSTDAYLGTIAAASTGSAAE